MLSTFANSLVFRNEGKIQSFITIFYLNYLPRVNRELSQITIVTNKLVNFSPIQAQKPSRYTRERGRVFIDAVISFPLSCWNEIFLARCKRYMEGVKSLAVRRYDGSRCISFRANKCRAERMWKRSRVNERRRELKEGRRVGERVMEWGRERERGGGGEKGGKRRARREDRACFIEGCFISTATRLRLSRTRALYPLSSSLILSLSLFLSCSSLQSFISSLTLCFLPNPVKCKQRTWICPLTSTW